MYLCVFILLYFTFLFCVLHFIWKALCNICFNKCSINKVYYYYIIIPLRQTRYPNAKQQKKKKFGTWLKIKGARSQMNINSRRWRAESPRASGGLWYKVLRRHDSVTVHLMEADLSHAVLETTGACTRRDVSPLTDPSLKLPDATHRRDYKCSFFPLFYHPPSLKAGTMINEQKRRS